MRSVLIVTPFFAPQTHAAVYRAYKLAKYLPEYGWKPYVLTVDTNYLYNEDAGLLAGLPDEVEIIRARYVQPTLGGVRMALGGADRRFVAQKASMLNPSGDIPPASKRHHAELRQRANRFYSGTLREWVHVPDAYRTWYRPAVTAGRTLIERYGIDLVYTTALPYTSHRIGRALQQTGARWVADFRDPATYGEKFSAVTERGRSRQREIVEETLRRADAVTALSSSYGLIFTDLYGAITRQPIRFIPTGIDDRLIPAGSTSGPAEPAARGAPYIVYAGEIMPEQTDDFFVIFASALAGTVLPHRLVVIGHEILNRQRLVPLLERYDLLDRVEFIDHMPQADLYRLIMGAAAGVLAPGRLSYWWNNHAKLVDYVGLRRPVLALVPDPSEARSVLSRSRLGVFLDGDDVQAAQTLTAFLAGDLAMPEPSGAECDRYLASSQVRSFVDVFESVL